MHVLQRMVSNLLIINGISQKRFTNKRLIKLFIQTPTYLFSKFMCSNNAMSLFAKIKGKQQEFTNPRSLGEGIMRNLPPSEMVESCSVAGPGFVNIVLSKNWIAQVIHSFIQFLFLG